MRNNRLKFSATRPLGGNLVGCAVILYEGLFCGMLGKIISISGWPLLTKCVQCLPIIVITKPLKHFQSTPIQNYWFILFKISSLRSVRGAKHTLNKMGSIREVGRRAAWAGTHRYCLKLCHEWYMQQQFGYLLIKLIISTSSLEQKFINSDTVFLLWCKCLIGPKRKTSWDYSSCLPQLKTPPLLHNSTTHVI